MQAILRYSDETMPILEDPPAVARPTPIVVEPSPVMELFGAVLALRTGNKHPVHPLFDPENPRSVELARRVREFWPRESSCFSEVLIVAHAGGLLFEQDVDELLARLPEAAQLDIGEPTLASETPEDRAELISRLDRLRRDAGLRSRWVELFAELWEEMRETWETEGLREVRIAGRRVRSRLDQGDSVWDLDARLLCWREDPKHEVRERVGAVVLSYFLGGWKVLIDLPGLVVVGLRLDGGDEVTNLRERATPLAERMKALSDATRLAILAHLSARPARITDVARSFGISQPTASVHFRVLRDAGLVATDRRDGQTLYSADRRRVETLLEEGRQLVTRP
jgi:DNA-binding transcriptional ArsR family regulator